jgi:hypothetical protein
MGDYIPPYTKEDDIESELKEHSELSMTINTDHRNFRALVRSMTGSAKPRRSRREFCDVSQCLRTLKCCLVTWLNDVSTNWLKSSGRVAILERLRCIWPVGVLCNVATKRGCPAECNSYPEAMLFFALITEERVSR